MIRRAAFVERFVLPFVAGGEAHVAAPLGFAGLARLAGEPADSEAERWLSSARWALAAEHLVEAEPPFFDEESLRLAIAVHDLLFLAHPEAPEAVRGEGHRRVAAGCIALTLGIEATSDPATLVARHTLLHHLTDAARTDVRISFWAGRREYRGQRPPPRLSAWPRLRRVSEERWRVGCLAEAAGDVAGGGEAASALLRASPLTDLLDPLRLDPPFELRDLDGLAAALADPAVCRIVAYHWLEEGVDRTGAAFAAALVKRLGAREPADLGFALSLLAHLHLCLIVAGERPRAEALRAVGRGDAALRDFFGLFAALHKTAPGRAAPADARNDARFAPAIEEHAAACAAACGSARTRELIGLCARTLDATENFVAG